MSDRRGKRSHSVSNYSGNGDHEEEEAATMYGEGGAEVTEGPTSEMIVTKM